MTAKINYTPPSDPKKQLYIHLGQKPKNHEAQFGRKYKQPPGLQLAGAANAAKTKALEGYNTSYDKELEKIRGWSQEKFVKVVSKYKRELAKENNPEIRKNLISKLDDISGSQSGTKIGKTAEKLATKISGTFPETSPKAVKKLMKEGDIISKMKDKSRTGELIARLTTKLNEITDDNFKAVIKVLIDKREGLSHQEVRQQERTMISLLNVRRGLKELSKAILVVAAVLVFLATFPISHAVVLAFDGYGDQKKEPSKSDKKLHDKGIKTHYQYEDADGFIQTARRFPGKIHAEVKMLDNKEVADRKAMLALGLNTEKKKILNEEILEKKDWLVRAFDFYHSTPQSELPLVFAEKLSSMDSKELNQQLTFKEPYKNFTTQLIVQSITQLVAKEEKEKILTLLQAVGKKDKEQLPVIKNILQESHEISFNYLAREITNF